ncbi:hypothetical protein [Propionivibrio dicarboxylicus]|uniref:Uncharacterized protein n=1 Tax=Propionivibrio dicarboxylicus TaxID=83767 RepID=A0A1G8L9I9_9RHOO|nr:hypothetical protein [Propionivibrio dicarboxylicus]SDI52187.1 hypothetical protein SAMN05660652_03576 [Propionivibrio dicarboxylicus]
MDHAAFLFVDSNPRIAVLFKKDEGVKSKSAIAVFVVLDGSTKLLGSTGFDAPACGLFSTIFDLGSGFAGNLYKNRKTVGDLVIQKGISSQATLTVRIGDAVNSVVLKDDDVSALKALFGEIGRLE